MYIVGMLNVYMQGRLFRFNGDDYIVINGIIINFIFMLVVGDEIDVEIVSIFFDVFNQVVIID